MSFVDYFFVGNQYIRVHREETDLGTVDPGHPQPITNWGWPEKFGENGIDCALYSGSKCYFFKGDKYVRVTRNGTVDTGQQDFTSPHPISEWGWPAGFGVKGINAALWSGSFTYFFSGRDYIRVRRNGDDDLGKTDPGYPAPISDWKFPPGFGRNGITGALPSGSVCYLFDGPSYIRVHRGMEGTGFVDKGYPRKIKDWGWSKGFGTNGIDAALPSWGPLVTQPTPNSGDNNYFMQDGGKPLLGVQATVNFDENFISTSGGFSFQLNAYSQEGYLVTWQQYCMYCDGSTTLTAQIDNWSGTDAVDSQGNKNQIVNVVEEFATLPSSAMVKQGYQFKFALTYSGNSVSGCIYTVIDNAGKTVGSYNFNILSQTGVSGGQLTSTDIAPIVAFVVNIGGMYSAATATIAAGAAGTITYTSTNPLTAVDGEPSFTSFGDPSNAQTGENANINFGPLPNVPHKSVSQLFCAS